MPTIIECDFCAKQFDGPFAKGQVAEHERLLHTEEFRRLQAAGEEPGATAKVKAQRAEEERESQIRRGPITMAQAVRNEVDARNAFTAGRRTPAPAPLTPRNVTAENAEGRQKAAAEKREAAEKQKAEAEKKATAEKSVPPTEGAHVHESSAGKAEERKE
jgi:hypothetical protein